MPEMLTDAELLALPNGDPLLGKLTGDEARRRTVLQTGKPLGNQETRGDSNMLSVDHDKIALGISNWASQLSPALQRPAAMLASFPADALASLAEMFSAPEVIGTAKPVMAGAEALGSAVNLPFGRLARAGGAGAWAGAQKLPLVGSPFKAGVEAALEAWNQKAPQAAARMVGKAPALNDVLTDALNEARQAPKPTRVSLPGGDTYRAEGAVPSAANARPAPAATPRASVPPSAAPKTSGAAPSTPAPPPGPVPRQAAVAAKLKLSPQEFEAFRGLVDQGYEPQQVLKAIEGQRAAQALQQRLGTPTTAEVDAAVADRNAKGRWPQDHR